MQAEVDFYGCGTLKPGEGSRALPPSFHKVAKYRVSPLLPVPIHTLVTRPLNLETRFHAPAAYLGSREEEVEELARARVTFSLERQNAHLMS